MAGFGWGPAGGAMDILFLRDFRLELIIGIYEWERKVPQPVRLDLEIGLPDSKAGGTDNGAPGERPYHPGYYAAFLLDPDGNNIEAVFHGEAERSADSVVVTFEE